MVRDFDFVGIPRLPANTDAILLVEPNAVLPLSVAGQTLQAVDAIEEVFAGRIGKAAYHTMYYNTARRRGSTVVLRKGLSQPLGSTRWRPADVRPELMHDSLEWSPRCATRGLHAGAAAVLHPGSGRLNDPVPGRTRRRLDRTDIGHEP